MSTEKIISAGSKLASIAYNLAQRKDLPADIIACLDASRKEWDAATQAPSAPVALDERAAFEAWCDEYGFNRQHEEDRNGIHYATNTTRAYWVGWSARAALSVKAEPAEIPDGWQLVPKTATDEMHFACHTLNYADEIEAEWKAMLAAAPTPPTTGEA